MKRLFALMLLVAAIAVTGCGKGEKKADPPKVNPAPPAETSTPPEGTAAPEGGAAPAANPPAEGAAN